MNYDDKGERATRDIVSRAIYAEMRAGRTTPNGGVYIAMSHLGPEEVARRFPGMVKRCADCGFDLAGGRVEVVPTAHYLMGGVVVTPDTRTRMPTQTCRTGRWGWPACRTDRQPPGNPRSWDNCLIVVETGGLRILHWGDNRHNPPEHIWEQLGRTDILLMPVDDSQHVMGHPHVAEVIERVRVACGEGQRVYWVCTPIDESDGVEGTLAVKI